MTIYFKKGFKYQLTKDHTFTLPWYFADVVYESQFISIANRTVLVRKGYAWDGPSGPAIDTENFMQGSLRHDVKYQLMRLGILWQNFRETSDLQLVEDCAADGMWRIRQKWVYVGVKYGAADAAKTENARKEYGAGVCFDYQYKLS